MIHLLLALLATLAWALWFILGWTVWLPLIATLGLGVVSLTILAVRRIRARRSARALEKALVAQGDKQAANARPDKRQEIAALQQQMSEGIAQLKASNVGGKRRGEAAMYALPWYAIIGPPGAGKTTALRHSGLTFPFSDSALRGVGGTRNCDWWLTNEAILLDTAGRYATESQDQAEWLEFLDLLRTHRVNKPLNGLIIAVALPDIVFADEVALEAMAKKLRGRVDEVMSRLRMTLPVYFLVTKCDLVAGFVELFGNLRKSERSQPWGATIALDADKSDPGSIVRRELDLMIEGVHGRAVKRLANERDRRARESIYQFPIELAAVKQQLSDLIGQVFLPNAFTATPMFRGFYFSSGTQEGLPLSRTLERMSRAMGISAQPLETQPKLEPRSYFLHDVFTKVVFPDAELAARNRAEVRRQRFVRLAIAATAVAVAGTVAFPSVQSFRNNQRLIEETQRAASLAADIDWGDAEPVGEKLELLRPMLAQLEKLDAYARDGAPVDHRFLMYAGEEIHGPLLRNYVAHMHAGFVRTVKLELERELLGLTGERYYLEREKLKTYLMLSDVEHLDVEWATGRLTTLWAEAMKPTSDVSTTELRGAMLPHVAYYLRLIAPESGPRVKPVPADDSVVEKARAVLAAVPVKRRYESLFISSLDYALYDPAGDATRGNLQFPPLTLEDLLSDRPDVLKLFRSRQHQRTQRHYEVPGPYTDKGHFVVLANIEEAKKLLDAEAWVVPLSEDEGGVKMVAHLDRLAEDYEANYVRHWQAFFDDIDVTAPQSPADAVALFDAIRSDPESPQLRMLRALEDHTQWTKGIDDLLKNDRATRLIDTKVNAALSRRLRGLRLGVRVKSIRGKASRVPPTFLDAVEFGVPRSGRLQDAPLQTYLELIDKTRAALATPGIATALAERELAQARTKIEALLEHTNPTAAKMLGPMLLAPFTLKP